MIEDDIAKRFTIIKGKKRNVYECNATQRGVDQVLRKCSKTYRRYQLPDVCLHKFHIVVTEKPVQIIDKAVPEVPDQEKKLFQCLAITTCQLNLSLRQATSAPMISLLQTAFEEGFKYHAANPKASCHDLPRIRASRPQLRDTIIQLGSQREEENMNALRRIKFVTAALDNGTIHHRHMIFVNLLNPNAGLEPCYLLSETTDHFNTSNYKLFGEILFSRLAHQGITLVGFVGDNLRVQIRGLAHWSPVSMQRYAPPDEPEKCAVLYVPCSCHVLNLALVDLRKHDHLYDLIMKTLDALIVFLRKSEITNQLGCRAPEIPKTRWVYAYDAAMWITKHVRQINAVLTSDAVSMKTKKCLLEDEDIRQCLDGVPQHIIELPTLLEPVKKLMLTLEADRTPLSAVFPLIHSTLGALKTIEAKKTIEYLLPVIEPLHHAVEHRFHDTAKWDLIVTSYALTHPGRRHLRKIGNEGDHPITEDFSDDEDDSPEELKRTIQVSEPGSDAEDLAVSSDEDSDDYSENEDKDKDELRYKPIKIVDPFEYAELSFGDQSKINICKLIFDTITDLARNLQISERERGEIHQCLHAWIWGKSTAFPNLCLLKNSPWVYWKTEKKFETIKHLPTIALRLLSLPASQASCERLISRNRRILDAYRTNSKDDLIKSRNTMQNAVNINPGIIIGSDD